MLVCTYVVISLLPSIHVQNTPDGTPTTVHPKSDKLDIPTLKQDIPKFATWLTSEATTEWQKFLSDLPDKLLGQTDDTRWPMEDLFEHSMQDNHSNHHQPSIITDTSIGGNILADMFAEEQAPCEVSASFSLLFIPF